MQQYQELYDTAVRRLKEANDELCRPEEDVVAFMVCKNSQQAIHNFLKAYLLQNNIDVEANARVDDMYNQCMAINANFSKIDLAGFDCQADNLESRYCSGTEKVSRCFDIADSLDAFLRSENIIN